MNEKQRLITSLQKYAFNLIMLYFEQVVPNDGYAHDILEELVNEETEIKEYETAKEMYIDTIKSYDSDKQALLDITNTMLQEYISNILTWSERFTTRLYDERPFSATDINFIKSELRDAFILDEEKEPLISQIIM